MAVWNRPFTVLLRHTPVDKTAEPSQELGQRLLLSADSEQALLSDPNLGELLAEAAFEGWRRRLTLQVAVCGAHRQQ
jgi:hypothetical protein